MLNFRILGVSLLAVSGLFAQTNLGLIPLVWTQGQPPETIRKVVREVAEGGNTGFVWESRPHPDYLGPHWWSDLHVAVDEAKKLGLEVWIFDEWMYPSGIAGGLIVNKNPALANHVILDRTATMEGPATVDLTRAPGLAKKEERLVSIAAFRKGEFVDLSGKTSWSAPAGSWRVCWVTTKSLAPKAGWRMDNMIDVMNPAAVSEFIRLTHEATWEHFKDDFGRTIKGFFSDETGFRNITSYSSLPGTPGMPMPWSPGLAAYFERRKGYDIKPLLAAMWYDLGPRGRQARSDLMDVYATAFAEVFFKPQQEWCRAHGVRLIGHVVEDNHADHQLGYGPGHWFRAMQYLDVPGIDVVGYQVTPGMDAGGNPWSVGSRTQWDQEFFQFGLPSMARGAALMKKSREIFSEAFGANGWGEGLRMVKWIGDWHIVNGIGFLSPHAVTMKFNDPDCPPHFNATSGNPQARYYSGWAAYFKRWQRLLASTDPVYDAAVLYTAESSWVGPAQTADPVVRVLENQQISTAVLPYDVFAREGKFENGRWAYNGQHFRAVVLPYVKYVPAAAIRRLSEFARAGGLVVVVDRWPEASVDARGDEQVSEAVAALKQARNARLVSLPEVAAVVAPGAPVAMRVSNPALMISRRVGPSGTWLILHNRSLSIQAEGTLTVLGSAGRATLWDPVRDAYVSLPQTRIASSLSVRVALKPYEMAAVRIGEPLPTVEDAIAWQPGESVSGGWEVVSRGQAARRVSALDDWRRWEGLDQFAGTVTYCTTLRLAAGAAPVALDLGEVGEIAELRVNGRNAGVRIAPPYVFDITKLVHAGENQIEIDVTNTAQTKWIDGFSRGDSASGLLGPVRVLRAHPAAH